MITSQIIQSDLWRIIIDFSASQLADSKNAEIAKYVSFYQNTVSCADLDADGRFGKGPVSLTNYWHEMKCCQLPIIAN